MARSPKTEPTDRELEILALLWESGPLPLGEICTALRRHREVATTTVATVLGVMRDKGLVRRESSAQGYQWSAAVSRQAAAKNMVGRLLDRVFDGSTAMLVSHVLEAGKLNRDDVRQLRRLLDEHLRKLEPPEQQP